MRKYFQIVDFKRGQFLFEEDQDPENIYFLLEGEIEISKTFYIFRTDEKDTILYKGLQVSEFIKSKEYEFFRHNSALLKEFKKKTIPAEESFKSKYLKKSLVIGKLQPYEIIGVEEVMIEAKQRFFTAKCCSERAVMFLLKKSDLKKITLIDSSKSMWGIV